MLERFLVDLERPVYFWRGDNYYGFVYNDYLDVYLNDSMSGEGIEFWDDRGLIYDRKSGYILSIIGEMVVFEGKCILFVINGEGLGEDIGSMRSVIDLSESSYESLRS